MKADERAWRLGVHTRTRATALEALFREIETTRMAGVPMLHPRLAVAAVGFEPDADGRGACGVLVTPWFMNLVWLPLPPVDAGAPADDATAPRAPLAVGAKATRAIGDHAFEFIGAHEDRIGPYEACSLFSPMFEFEDQAAALATAQAVVDLLRPADPPGVAPAPVPAPVRPPPDAVPSRRALLFGRGGVAR